MNSLTRTFARAGLRVLLLAMLGIPVGCQRKAAVPAVAAGPKGETPAASAKPAERQPEPKSELPKFELPKVDEPDLLTAVPKGNELPAEPRPGQGPEIRGPRPPQTPIGTTKVSRDEIKKALEDIRIAIDNYSLASGQMPSPQLTYTIVKQAAPQYATLIESQKIMIHAAGNREDIWAYELKSDAKRIYVLFATGVEEMEMTAFRRRLGR